MKRLILLVVLLVGLLSAETIKRDRTALRTGPGAWFPLIAELSKGTEIKLIQDGDSWIHIKANSNEGFVSRKSLEGKVEKQDVFAQMAMMSSPSSVSQAGVSAAVKGFADRFNKRMKGDPEALNYLLAYKPDYSGYQSFHSELLTPRQLKKLRGKIDLPRLKKDKPFSFSEEGSGLSVAAKLASMGLVKNEELMNYVNLVGTYVAQQSHGYDIPFRFFILDQDGVNGYACPGGIIFITRGALELMESEAELACFLGHEISHVVYRHGMKEMEERKEMIIAGNAIDELSQVVEETEEEKATSQELDDIALNSYETIFSGRLGDYEEQADEIGILYAARSGYDPNSMVSFLERVGKNNAMQGSDHYSASQNELRIKRINKYLNARRWKKTMFVDHQGRFIKLVSF